MSILEEDDVQQKIKELEENIRQIMEEKVRILMHIPAIFSLGYTYKF